MKQGFLQMELGDGLGRETTSTAKNRSAGEPSGTWNHSRTPGKISVLRTLTPGTAENPGAWDSKAVEDVFLTDHIFKKLQNSFIPLQTLIYLWLSSNWEKKSEHFSFALQHPSLLSCLWPVVCLGYSCAQTVLSVSLFFSGSDFKSATDGLFFSFILTSMSELLLWFLFTFKEILNHKKLKDAGAERLSRSATEVNKNVFFGTNVGHREGMTAKLKKSLKIFGGEQSPPFYLARMSKKMKTEKVHRERAGLICQRTAGWPPSVRALRLLIMRKKRNPLQFDLQRGWREDGAIAYGKSEKQTELQKSKNLSVFLPQCQPFTDQWGWTEAKTERRVREESRTSLFSIRQQKLNFILTFSWLVKNTKKQKKVYKGPAGRWK